MSFSAAQHRRFYRPMVKRAWLAHCQREGIAPNRKDLYEQWYRTQLMDTLGIYTTTQANKGGDFDTLMAHFEVLCADGSTEWQIKRAQGDEVRIRYMIREAMKTADVSDAYVRGIAEHMGFRADWENLPAKQMWRVWIALDRHIKRKSEVAGIRG